MSKLKEKQRTREEKVNEQIRKGKVKRIVYEERKKKPALPNRKSQAKTMEEELAERQDTAERAAIVYRQLLPGLLVKLGRIKDPRVPGKVKHKMTVLMIYGILLFVYQIGSRREAKNTEPCGTRAGTLSLRVKYSTIILR